MGIDRGYISSSTTLADNLVAVLISTDDFSHSCSAMAALEFENRNNSSINHPESLIASIRQRMAGMLFGVPDPAMQATAVQLMRSSFSLDRAFGSCLCLIGCAILEEIV